MNESQPMVFSATFACAHCRLRFGRRASCPSCGSAEVFSLATREGRARYRAAARTQVGGGLLLRLAPWAPARPLLSIGIALLMMAPAAIGLALGPRSFQDLWLMDDLTTRYEGLSSRGLGMIALAVAGALLLGLTLLARLGARTAAHAPAASAPRMRVFAPGEDARGDTTLTGIARRASVEIASVLSGEPCLLFGLRGEIGSADLADADGGDFDLELPSGERVMISLEHAVLVVDAADAADAADIHAASELRADLPEEIDGALAELLESRAIPEAAGAGALDERLVRDGDEVTVIGSMLGGTVTSLGYRGASGARVLAGDEERPLVVRVRSGSSSAFTSPHDGVRP